MDELKEAIALVTGASRGVGRGIAHELGSKGATVYVTGRSRDEGATTDDLPGTIDETARRVSTAGGHGIAVECDHTDDAAVDALAQRLRAEHDHVDLLVNNVWGGYEQYDARLFEQPLWEQPVWRWDKMFATGVRAHYTTSRVIAPLMQAAPRPLIVNISAGDDGKFLGDVQYDVVKAADNRLGFALAQKLRPLGITALTVHPGFTRTERVVAEEPPPEAMAQTHSPRFVGRAIVALVTDPDVMQRTGGVFKVGDLGLAYGFTDIDGTQPEPFTLPEADMP